MKKIILSLLFILGYSVLQANNYKDFPLLNHKHIKFLKQEFPDIPVYSVGENVFNNGNGVIIVLENRFFIALNEKNEILTINLQGDKKILDFCSERDVEFCKKFYKNRRIFAVGNITDNRYQILLDNEEVVNINNDGLVSKL